MKRLIKNFIMCIFALVLSLSVVLTITVNAATGEDIVNEARRWLGTSYGHSDGTGGPGTIVDCCGLVLQTYKKYGYTLPWTVAGYGNVIGQKDLGTKITNNIPSKDYSNLQMGDLIVFYGHSGSNWHIGIYSGNGYVISAQSSGVKEAYLNDYWYRYAIGVRRILGERQPVTPPSTPPKSDGGGKPSGISDTSRTLRWKELWQIYNDSTVTELQECLNYIMNTGLKVDGCYGIDTHDAVKEFQGTYGLKVDGDAGPQTLTKVNEVLNGISEPVHTHNYTGSYYDEAHPHKEYKKCDCSQIEYTGKTKQVENCGECHVHDYTVHYDKKHPHTQYKECDCGDIVYTDKTKQMDDCEKCHVHDYTVHYNKKHPHTQYKECDCGDIIIDENKTKKVESCEICYPDEEIIYLDGNRNKEKKERIVKLHIGIPQMTVDGKSQKIDPGKNTAPILMNGRTLLPIRAIVESFDAYVVWNEPEEKVSIYTDDVTMHLWINSKKASVNGKTYTMDVAPIIENERTFMPLRFIAEKLGLKVGWDESTQMITVEGEIVA